MSSSPNTEPSGKTKGRSKSEPTWVIATRLSRPDHYRGFAAELQAERAGEPVYPIWRELPVQLRRTEPREGIGLGKLVPVKAHFRRG
jgi:hypothetical protein